jgi:glycerol uptake facilitator protein
VDTPLATIFLSEVVGTAMLLLLGGGVVATAILAKSKGLGGGWLLINFGWGLAVFAGVTVSYSSGAHLNPAVSIGLLTTGAITFVQFLVYVAAQMVGAFIGAVLVWLTFKQHLDIETDPGAKLGVFSTGRPRLRRHRLRPRRRHRAGSPRGSRRPRCRPGRAPRGRYRCFPRWPDRVRHQPGP